MPDDPDRSAVTQAPQQQQPPPIGAASERSVDDRLGEALRRIRHGLIRPLWRDMTEADRDGWRNLAQSCRLTVFQDVGIKIEVADA